ncbi:hypothetical protein L7F22_032352 [Adiantum nelumboides]|nr:hypothetical protein [Adiantum nelumboides]
MVFVGYGDRLGVKAYRLYDPQLKKIQFAHSVYFDESSLITPQQGDVSSSIPTNPQPTLGSNPPQIEWEEADVWTPLPILVNAPQPPIQQVPISPTPINTPLPPTAPPWTLGRKTKTHLFPQLPNPLLPEPNPTSSAPSSPTRPHHTSPRSSIYPYVPMEPIHQPSLLGPSPSPSSHPSKSSKVRSLKEIYEQTTQSLQLAPYNLIDSESTVGLTTSHDQTAEALYHQVLQNYSSELDAVLLAAESVEDLSLDKALSGPAAFSWRQAMESGYQSLMDNGTWQLVPAPPNRKLVTCKWLLRKKLHADGTVSRYKARLLARGFTQVPGMDYTEIFSLVLRVTSFRVLIAIAAQFGFLLHQMDVCTAFLNGDLQEEIYMTQPDGGYTSSQHPDYVCKLFKSLYGLKQSPRQWYQQFHQCMITLGYARFQSDANVYRRNTSDTLLFLAIYVDDILLLSNSHSALNAAK